MNETIVYFLSIVIAAWFILFFIGDFNLYIVDPNSGQRIIKDLAPFWDRVLFSGFFAIILALGSLILSLVLNFSIRIISS